MSSLDSLPVFARLAAELHQEPDEATVSQAIVTRLREVVPEARRVSLAVRESRGLRTAASSDRLANEADALQYALGEGPAIDVVDQGGWLRVGDVESDVRWQGWAPRASAVGVRSLLTLALVEGEETLGALTAYGADTGGFSDREVVEHALAYAAHAATALACTRRAATLETAVSSRHVIGMAQGIAMERYGIDAQQSFELLRRLSSTTNVKLRDVAAQIVETRTIPVERSREHAED
ncbi:GAF and ANTAR domain-containing protein [Nocardioides lacusdianchii]|uniref:GAF and ANTAR domain-containing protein n=1 Tax=Nocardioides lacusdianchii TaxID=2783664 RepID=UPI001CCEC0BE|nr:GAF and ANTAR domain-containing protein [Nocardioides lacusdianchii]